MKLFGSFRKHYLKLTSPPHRAMYAAHRQWRRDKGEARRYEFPFLTADATVLDLGGYRGEWADGIFDRYQPTIHIFEPHPVFAAQLQEKYRSQDRIHVHPCALASHDGEFSLSDLADGSSTLRHAKTLHTCCTVEAGRYLKSIGVQDIDLVKMNIEGGEYDILPYLGQTGLMQRIRTLQVQFHLFGLPNIQDRDRIRELLNETHTETWCYPFVWEQWDRR